MVKALTQDASIDPSILRTIWLIVVDIHFQDLFSLPDQELHERLLQEIDRRLSLSEDQRGNILNYLHSRMMLIRDMAGAY